MKNIQKLISLVDKNDTIYIQTHDFPDHDAVVSAFALQYLLQTQGITTHLIYEGTIQRDSLNCLIQDFKINIKSAREYQIKEQDKIMIVDGCKGNKNVTDLIGTEMAVIDHHVVASPEDVLFYDIRSNYGACASMIYTYFRDLNMEIPRNIATALMIGLEVDTALMTRGVSREDVVAYSDLYVLADMNFVNALMRNNIQVKDLNFYKKAIENIRIQNKIAFCFFSEGCNQNLLGIIADFFLSLNEVEFVFLCANNDNVINFSIRNESRKWNAALIIREILKDIGFGGGHIEMAGGIIKDKYLFDEKEIFYKLHGILN